MFVLYPMQSGSLYKGITKGRQELLRLIKRTKYGELSEKALRKKKLRHSPLGMAFLLQDAVGAELLTKFTIGSGTFYKVAKL